MKRMLRIGRGVKVRRARAKEICDLPIEAMDVDTRMELIQRERAGYRKESARSNP